MGHVAAATLRSGYSDFRPLALATSLIHRLAEGSAGSEFFPRQDARITAVGLGPKLQPEAALPFPHKGIEHALDVEPQALIERYRAGISFRHRERQDGEVALAQVSGGGCDQ